MEETHVRINKKVVTRMSTARPSNWAAGVSFMRKADTRTSEEIARHCNVHARFPF